MTSAIPQRKNKPVAETGTFGRLKRSFRAGCLLTCLAFGFPLGFTQPAEAAGVGTEFCAANSPDGTLNLRSTPSLKGKVIKVLYNGDCGIFIVENPARSEGFVRASVGNLKGWVKSKWLMRAVEYRKQAGGPAPSTKAATASGSAAKQAVTGSKPAFDQKAKPTYTQGEVVAMAKASLAEDGYTDASSSVVADAVSRAMFYCRILNDPETRNELIASYRKSGLDDDYESIDYWIRDIAGNLPINTVPMRGFVFGISSACSEAQSKAIFAVKF